MPSRAQVELMTRLVGNLPSVTPGRTNGVGRAIRAEAAPTGELAKTPLTKDASLDVNVVEIGCSSALKAERVTLGASRVTSSVL